MDARRLQIQFSLESVRIKDNSDMEIEYIWDTEKALGLPLLPEAINSNASIAQISLQYQSFFRQMLSCYNKSAMDEIREQIGAFGNVDLRFTASENCHWAYGYPWELLLYDGEQSNLLKKLLRVAPVRSLGITNVYSPRRIDEKFRVLLLQGPNGNQQLDFKGERLAINEAWESLGPTLKEYVNPPVICPANIDQMVSDIEQVKPHLIWFSGHGQSLDNDFKLLMWHGKNEEWISISTFRDSLINAANMTGILPIIIAFWACESGYAPKPSFDAAGKSFPILVSNMLDIGVEAVIGVQNRIYDSTAKIMGCELFRSLAEGHGPAQSLSSARVKLLSMSHRRSTPRGQKDEWVSPVIWVNGANIPTIQWGRPFDTEEALAFYRFGTESFLSFEGGQDLFQESIDTSNALVAVEWISKAPMWLICSNLYESHQYMQIVRQLKNLVLHEKKTVIIIKYNGIVHSAVLDAVADGFRDVLSRAFPRLNSDAWDFLLTLGKAFQSGSKRYEAWCHLLDRKDIVLAFIAEGGMPADGILNEAITRNASLLVFSSCQAIIGNSERRSWENWHVDKIDSNEIAIMITSIPLKGFLAAFAVYNKPLSRESLDELAHDFDQDIDEALIERFLAPLGRRYVLKATIAGNLLKHLSADAVRAAHRACFNLLSRIGDEFDTSSPHVHIWMVQHALQANEYDQALEWAQQALDQLVMQDIKSNKEIIKLFRSLKEYGRKLSITQLMHVAEAFIYDGNPRRARDLLLQIPITAGSPPAEKLRFAVLKAEALRNLLSNDDHMESIHVLESAIKEYTGIALSIDDDRRWLLIAKHDLGRNIHYFKGDTPEACKIYQQVIHECGDACNLAYLKAASLRNLADALDNYTFDKVNRNPEVASKYISEAVKIAENSAMTLLPEMLYIQAKYEYAKQRDAGFIIQLAIARAREYGNVIILALAKNKQFWWRMKQKMSDDKVNESDFIEWSRLENELDLLASSPWPLRALIDSRIRAGKCFSLLSNSSKAIEVLEKAQILLVKNNILHNKSDWKHRWLPVYAGLAILSRPQNKQIQMSDDADLWSSLRDTAANIGLCEEIGDKSVFQVWKEVF